MSDLSFWQMGKHLSAVCGYLACGALSLAAASFLVTGLCFGKPTVLGIRPYFILTESMEPVIRQYQFVLTVPTEADEVSIGDIIVYKKRGSAAFGYHVIHRIIAVGEGGFVLKGDNNRDADQNVVFPEQVMYRVIFY